RIPTLRLPLFQSLRSSVAEFRSRLCRSFDRARSPRCVSRSLCSLELLRAGALRSGGHQKSPDQSALDRNRSPKSDSFELLQLRRQLPDEIFDLLSLVPMTNQNRIACPDDDQIMHAEQRDCCLAVVEDNVIAGIECGQRSEERRVGNECRSGWRE